MDAGAGSAAEKELLRRERLGARRARPQTELARARAAVAAHVLRRSVGDGWRCVAAFVPLRTEPGSTGLLDGLRSRGVRVLVPVLRADKDLDWAEWGGTGAGAPTLGRGAVAAADAVLVPALAVALDGTRLGRGGGSYDRALLRCEPAALLAALVFDEEILTRVPCEPWDVPVGHAITPAGWRRLAPTRVDAE